MAVLIARASIAQITGTAAVAVPAPSIVASGTVGSAPAAITGTAAVAVPVPSIVASGTFATPVAEFTETWGENSTDDHQSVTTDTRIKSGAATTNFGTSDALFTEWTGDGIDDWTTLIRFDLSALPADADITDARVTFVLKNTTAAAVTIRAFECLRADWERLQATWDIYKTGSNWGTAGARGNSSDVNGTPALNTGSLVDWSVPSGSVAGFTFTSDNLASHIQALVDEDPGPLNIAVHAANPTTQHLNFHSSRGTDGSRPKLTITYNSVTGGGGPPGGPGALGRYVAWTDGKIYDLLGNVFTPRGMCAYVTQPGANVDTYLTYMGNPGWAPNIIRLQYFPPGGAGGASGTPLSVLHDAIVKYTAAGIVVWIDWHIPLGNHLTPGAADPNDLNDAAAFFGSMAAIYKDNPRVWYGTQNEPGGSSDTTALGVWNTTRKDQWVTSARTITAAVRAEGALAPIVAASMMAAQDLSADSLASGPFAATYALPLADRSAIVEYWSEIVTGFDDPDTAHPNIVGDVHLYGNYSGAGGDAALDEFLAYVNANGIPIIFGEYGMQDSQTFKLTSAQRMQALRGTRYFGECVYVADAADQYNLTTTAPVSGRFSVQDTANYLTTPTNLKAIGEIAWNATHPGTFPP